MMRDLFSVFIRAISFPGSSVRSVWSSCSVFMRKEGEIASPPDGDKESLSAATSCNCHPSELFATIEELKSFHSEEYIEFLKKINGLTEEELLDEQEEEMEKYGIGYDCPFIPQIFDAAAMIGGATVTAAKALLSGEYEIAVNWGGIKRMAFCYVNDIVLGILHLLQKYKRVLYVDLDLHHGDGVEEAFAHTSRVLCFSIHKHEVGFYPGTGLLNDIGYGKGKYYTINVPLFDGIQDSQYIELIIPLLSKTQKKFQPDIVVCQCGADTLAGDPFAAFNLTLRAPAECIKLFKSWNIPLLVLGGGGYNAVNTARCWTYLLSLLVNKTVESDIPDHKVGKRSLS
ncbi:histone deacetylase 8 [Caerostris extrusa]|uniref:Histone deacetylase 8 n=1 Tax=Caerostris extrusa TaxID=172846 RepID=A0AAV4SNM9_CAEEX|nr:histone deacetylase 8 [Caerostris extrusa]